MLIKFTAPILYIGLAGIIFLVFLAIYVAGYRFNELVLSVYTSFLRQRPRTFNPEWWQGRINMMVGVYVAMLYVLFRLREHLRLQNLEEICRQRELEALFRMETEFLEQLRSQGIELKDPSSDLPDSSFA
ncbi:uncharacterized protein LOC108094239 [Drosophila ficusphila]|uniref:uncharacterized protein LOC108094239 n=1 Tax=Drosophila ficusphila TaxID=30025 RepID=UPI0007E732A4|nr:uncharacterized protein LOC108094239 [Drosophila ficusphila]